MKDIEINGIVLTGKVMEVIFQLQNNTGMKEMYIDVIDEVTRSLILNVRPDNIPDNVNFARIKALTMLRCDIETLFKARDDGNGNDD